MLAQARAAGDEELLKMSFDSLLASPKGRIQQFNGQVYGYREDEMEELLAHVFSYAWPQEERSLPGEEIAIEFIPMSDEEWAIRQGKA
ncbi:MAG: hypothetical protein COB16_09600 [Rhodobacteraceae bacterium]|nr:MAG: hypothetical protein COB16_09600 [Paracoccaceae bacterium]